MTAAIEFCLLGPFEVRCDGAAVPVPAGKQRAVLAALLLSGGQTVPVDVLARALWGADLPASARVTVQTYVMRLRKALGPSAGIRISTQPGGYRISIEAGELDVTRFEQLVRTAGAAARDGSWAVAAGRARAALELWRGEPLADAGSKVLSRREGPRLAELRLEALQVRVEADLEAGRQAEVIAELQALAAAEPLRERVQGLLMLALYRDGRPGEALAAYQRARQALAEELGAEPGPGLRELHQRILAGEPAAGAAIGPRQLPGMVPHFAGRTAELAALTALLDQVGEKTAETVVISAISGTAGVGKTALAVRWAHQVADRFPDGQLYVNLRGYDPDQPVTAADALAGFLSALGVAGPDIPAGADERAARFRSLLAGRRMLVVLDNAREVEQVRLLLPGAPDCMVVVTSRDSLAGLVARHGATRLEVDPLPLDDAVALLCTLIGARADADPYAAAALAEQCARLPLALRVAAELAAALPASSLAELVHELAGQQRLDLLDAGGDPRTAVRAVFSWSCRYLDDDAARVFRLLGLHPGPDLDRYAAAALAGTTAEAAARLLGQLARAHLIQPAQPGRFGLHDLLREYAAEQAARAETGPGRQAALTRLFDHYLHAAAAAMDALTPAEAHRRPRIPPPATPVPPVTDSAAARAWLDAERAVLVAVAGFAAARGSPSHATRLAATVWRYLDIGGHYPEATAIHGHAHRAARQIGDRGAEAAALTSLGVAAWRLGRYQQAADHYQQALALCREAGDRTGEGRALVNLGGLDWHQGRYQQAAGHFRQVLPLWRETGDRTGEAHALSSLGVVEWWQGRYQDAVRHHQQALALCREIGDRYGEAHVLTNLGRVDQRLGRYQEAARHHEQALVLFRETHDPAGEAEALNGLGETLLATGQHDPARARHAAALELASRIGDHYQQARAHDGLARARQSAGEPGPARRHWHEALARYANLGAPEAGAVRARLADLGDAANQDIGVP